MRIVIDMQGAQSTGSRNRGIGRYTLSLSKAIVRNRGEHEIIIVLNDRFPETIEPIRKEFNNLLPQENIRLWYAPGSVSADSASNTWHRKSAELVREAFIANINPDFVVVTSLFEGLDDDAVTSIGLLDRNVPVATILYDLIPLINRQLYLENPVVEAWYENKLDHLRRSDILLAISESSRQEGMLYLGIQEDASVNISTAADQQFQPQKVSRKQETRIREKYKLQRHFVMYTGGIDHRKNIEGLIRAYASLPKSLRAQHQLAVVCSIQQHDKIRLEDLAKKYDLKQDELVLTGFVPEDDLLVLYNLCKMFVFPSWHEGFGLPALEAMSCGRAVIGSNCSSVPEVLGREDVLFDPRSDDAIAEKITRVLTDDNFRIELERHGLEQAKKFSWDKSAVRAINSFETYHIKHQQHIACMLTAARRPKLAYISPLPPQRSGISDYSSELLRELSRYYDIDVVVEQESVNDPWVNSNSQIRNVEWFRSNAYRYGRVLYHFGNSHFHHYMLSLLEQIPGVVVLHDFFLSGLVAHMDVHGLSPNIWVEELYIAHGYNSVRERFHANDPADVVVKYPCNLRTLRAARNVIVHSENSRRLAKYWYGTTEADYWAVIPLLRTPAINRDRNKACHILNISAENFVICSFGLISPTKLNHRLMEAWLSSKLAKDKNCILVFVGENDGGEYGQALLDTILRSGLSKQIHITGWADKETFHNYLSVADVGVQLRTNSRGETSAAVLDCMNYGLPTVVNANGSMGDLDDDAVWKLPDEFSNEQLVEALETLWRDKPRRTTISNRARELILEHHAPRTCAEQYYKTIENSYRDAAKDISLLTDALSEITTEHKNDDDIIYLSEAIAKSIPPKFTSEKLLLDVSWLIEVEDSDSEKQVIKQVLHDLLIEPPDGVRVEPVYATKERSYHYAREFTLKLVDCPSGLFEDEPIEYQAGDVFIGLGCQYEVLVHQKNTYQRMRRNGVKVKFFIDSSFFQNSTDKDLIEIIAESNGVACISNDISEELNGRLEMYGVDKLRPFKVTLVSDDMNLETEAHALKDFLIENIR